MRELKFRIWDLKYNEMLPKSDDYGQYLLSLHGKCFLTTGVFQTKKYALDNCVLMQYTGLKDKNGKEIYEGDILEYHVGFKDSQINLAPITNFRIVKSLVEFRDGCYYAGLFDFTTPTIKNTDNIEVIGNIFENAELLK